MICGNARNYYVIEPNFNLMFPQTLHDELVIQQYYFSS